MKKCFLCGGDTVTIKDRPYQYDECGLDVAIHGLTQYECPSCHELFVSIPNIENLHRAIGTFICARRKALLTAAEIKFLRKNLQLKAKELAAVLGVTPQTISRWENGRTRIGETQDRLLRSVYVMYASEKANHIVCHGMVQLFSGMPRIRKDVKLPRKIDLNPTDWLASDLELCDA